MKFSGLFILEVAVRQFKLSYLGKSHCKLSDLVLQTYHRVTGCLRLMRLWMWRAHVNMGCSSRMDVPVPNKWYSGAAFMREQCSGPFTGDSRLCVHHFLIASVQQYIMFISLQPAGIFFSIDFTHLVLRESTLLLLTRQPWPKHLQCFWNSNRRNQLFSIDIFPSALHIGSSCTPFSLDRCCFLCITGLFQASSLHTDPLSRHLKQLFCSVSLLCSHSYCLLEREPGCIEFCVCFLVPGVTPPPPPISAPTTIYLSCLSVAGKQMEHPRPGLPGRVSLFSMIIFRLVVYYF